MPDLMPPAGNRMKSSYIRVIVVWVITLAALYAFQEVLLVIRPGLR